MADFLIYILKSSCCLTLFYLVYKLLLSNETFFGFNRKILLVGISFCILAPFIHIKVEQPGKVHQSFMQIETFLSEETNSFYEQPKQTYLSIPAQNEKKKNIAAITIYSGIYGIGVIISLLILLSSCLSLYTLIKKGKKIATTNGILIVTDKTVYPLNWWKYIILPTEDYKNNPEEILIHEQAHYRKRHSLDLIFLEIIILLHWFNPFIRLLKRELQEIHEYEADSAVLKSGIDATRYQLLLVKKAVGASSYTFANSFNHSKLKKRITMMLCQKRSNRWNRWKAIFLLPVAVGTLYAFAQPETTQTLEQFLPNEDTTISIERDAFTAEYFNSQFNNWIKEKEIDESVFFSQKFRELEKEYHTVRILVNALDQILYNGEYANIESLMELISEDLQKETKNKPVILFLMTDRETSLNTKEEILNIIGNSFIQNETVLERKGQQGLLCIASPRMFNNSL